MKKVFAAFILLTLTFSGGLAAKDPNFRHDFAQLAPQAFTALVALTQEDKLDRERKHK